jgi:ABC-2 type transport system permease protein
MTDSNPAPTPQLSAIAWLRWRLFVNSLRSTRGQLELVSRILISVAFIGGGFGGASLMGTLAFFFLSTGKPALLAFPFWGIFFFWQAFPIMATAFTNNPDSSDLLRFPLSYRSFFLVRIAYGACDPATFLGCLWSLGILVGLTIAKPALFPWALVVIVTFVAFNLLFMQMLFAWIERWLAQRRTREIMGVLFILVMLSFQLIGPLTGHFGRRSQPETQRFVAVLAPAERILPPGLTADAIVEGIYPQWPAAVSSLALLCGFGLIVGYGLHIRLVAQYRGENLSEVAATKTLPGDRPLRMSWNLPQLAPPVAAVFEKEIRYLMRSGPMLITLIMPVFALFVFRFSPASSHHNYSGGFLVHTPNLAFPLAASYALLMLTNLVYNIFGSDAGGIQFFYASPVRFREIVLGKNLAHTCVLVAEATIAWISVTLLYGRPAFDITIATVAALLFAAPVNFAVGDVLSVYSPKKLDYSKFGRQRASQITVLISLVVEFAIVAISASIFLTARYLGSFWIATLILLILAGVSIFGYAMTLNYIERLVSDRRETLITELCRA